MGIEEVGRNRPDTIRRKLLALAQKMYEDNTLRIHEILDTKIELTLALHP